MPYRRLVLDASLFPNYNSKAKGKRMVTAAIVLLSIGMVIMLGSLGWGIAKLLSWRKNNPKEVRQS